MKHSVYALAAQKKSALHGVGAAKAETSPPCFAFARLMGYVFPRAVSNDTSQRKSMQQTALGYGSALLATIIWSGNFVVARALATLIPPWQCNFWRWLVALLVLLPFARRHLRRDWPGIKKHWAYLSLMGILGITLMNTLIYKAGQDHGEPEHGPAGAYRAHCDPGLLARPVRRARSPPAVWPGWRWCSQACLFWSVGGTGSAWPASKSTAGISGPWAARSASACIRSSCANARNRFRLWASMWPPSAWVCSARCRSPWPRPACCPCPAFPRQ